MSWQTASQSPCSPNSGPELRLSRSARRSHRPTTSLAPRKGSRRWSVQSPQQIPWPSVGSAPYHAPRRPAVDQNQAHAIYASPSRSTAQRPGSPQPNSASVRRTTSLAPPRPRTPARPSQGSPQKGSDRIPRPLQHNPRNHGPQDAQAPPRGHAWLASAQIPSQRIFPATLSNPHTVRPCKPASDRPS